MGVILTTIEGNNDEAGTTHTRGGDPVVKICNALSIKVLPTHVGVIRIESYSKGGLASTTHTRGGDPCSLTIILSLN